MQPGDSNGVLFAERKHNEIAAQESSAFQVLRDGLRVLADFGELAQNFRKIDGADGRAAKQRVLDYIGARFIVEVGEEGRGIEDTCRVFQSGLGRLALCFRSSVGDELIGQRAAAGSRPVKPSCLSHDLTRALQAEGAVRLQGNNQLITLAEV
jgi:hypothetical protein